VSKPEIPPPPQPIPSPPTRRKETTAEFRARTLSPKGPVTTYESPHRLQRESLLNRLPPLPPLPEPAPPPSPRIKPYDPPAEIAAQWANTAINHFVAVRATGSLPEIGGPSWPVTLPASPEGIAWTLEQAEKWWPNARSFDLIGGDLEYKSGGGNQEDESLAAGMNRLRNAAVITTIAVVDRPPVVPPAGPAAPAAPAEPEAEPEKQA
jgi:hypothetical protein